LDHARRALPTRRQTAQPPSRLYLPRWPPCPDPAAVLGTLRARA